MSSYPKQHLNAFKTVNAESNSGQPTPFLKHPHPLEAGLVPRGTVLTVYRAAASWLRARPPPPLRGSSGVWWGINYGSSTTYVRPVGPIETRSIALRTTERLRDRQSRVCHTRVLRGMAYPKVRRRCRLAFALLLHGDVLDVLYGWIQT